MAIGRRWAAAWRHVAGRPPTRAVSAYGTAGMHACVRVLPIRRPDALLARPYVVVDHLSTAGTSPPNKQINLIILYATGH
jgi:hypothetical protein